MQTQTLVELPNGGTVQVRAGLLTGIGPSGPLGPVGPAGPVGPQGPAGTPGATTNYESLLSGPVSGTLSIPNNAATWTNVPLPTQGTQQLLATPYNQNSFTFLNGGSYLVIARARFDAISGDTMNHKRSLRLYRSDGTVLEQVSVTANPTDPTDVVLVKLVNDPGSAQTYVFQASADDTNGAVNLSDLEVQIALIGSGPTGPGIHELTAGAVSNATPLSTFADGFTVAPISGDSTTPDTAGTLQTVSLSSGTEGSQIFSSTARTGSTTLPRVWSRTWDGTNNLWLPWSELTTGDGGPIAYTPQIYNGATVVPGTSGVGKYTKIGKLITFDAYVEFGSSVGGSGNYYVTLPLTPSVNQIYKLVLGALEGFPSAGPGWCMMRMNPNNKNMQVVYNTNNYQVGGVGSSSFGGAQAGAAFYYSGTFYVD